MSENTDFTGDGAFSDSSEGKSNNAGEAITKLGAGLDKLGDYVSREQLKVFGELNESLRMLNDGAVPLIVASQERLCDLIEKLVEREKGGLSEASLVELLLAVRKGSNVMSEAHERVCNRMLKTVEHTCNYIEVRLRKSEQ